MNRVMPIPATRSANRSGHWTRTTRCALWYLPLIHFGYPALVPWPRPDARLAVPPSIRLVGRGLALLGCCLTTGSVYTLVRYGDGTPAPHDPPQVFVTHGPYQHCRNPMELGNFLTLLGRAIISGSLRTGVASVLFAVSIQAWIVLVEEPYLERHFGSSYRAYQQQVPRWGWRLRGRNHHTGANECDGSAE